MERRPGMHEKIGRWGGASALIAVGAAIGSLVAVCVVNEKVERIRAAVHFQSAGRAAYAPVSGRPYFEPVASFEAAAAASLNSVVYIGAKTADKNSYFGFNQILNVPRMGTGSGVILTQDGYIVTNNHVVQGAKEIIVTLNDKSEYEADLIATDPNTDLAVIKIDAQGLSPIVFGNSDEVQIGQWVLAVGNPLNLTSTVTAGIVSAKARNIGILHSELGASADYAIESFIQTDAVVNPGNSGGALVNLSGELIGVNTAIATESGVFAGYSFAIPSNLVKKVVADLMEYGEVQRGFIGVSIQDINAKIARERGLATLSGALITDLTSGGAAQAAGLRTGDVIVAIDGFKVGSASELQERVALRKPGDKVSIEVVRGKESLSFFLTLRNRRGTYSTVAADDAAYAELAEYGASFVQPELSELKKRGLDFGVMVTDVKRNGKFYKVGIESGFIITKVDRKAVKTVEDLVACIGEAEDLIYIEGYKSRGEKAYYSVKK
ncbi:MAG: trypsin-like peptidase domain-containing protein [Bacteroidia bacterium]|nr:trypsin-like peptidase domain-containing protein [Bacteroidia bacterium]MDW8333038.1 trypsin-like peptidase domain-containing protein [Bacteroidia bacterium]